MTKHRIGLALGSGAARGWAHIGVLRALESMNIRPDVICGTSVGALVGGAFLTDQLDDLQDWAKSMGLMGVLRLVDITFPQGGLVAIHKAFERFRNPRTDVPVETLPVAFGTVATDLATGREIWLREGHLLDVVRASAAMPGLFPAVRHDGRWLVDGAMVNPVPVSLCRAMGADIVIAVNLNAEMSTLPRLTQPVPPTPPKGKGPAKESGDGPLAQMLARMGAARLGERAKFIAGQLPADKEKEPAPNVIEILAASIDIMQDRITRARLAGEPADVLIQPRLGHIGILDFDRAEEAIEIGFKSTLAMTPAVEIALRRS